MIVSQTRSDSGAEAQENNQYWGGTCDGIHPDGSYCNRDMDLDDYHDCPYCDEHEWQEGKFNDPRESLPKQLPDFLIGVEVQNIESPKYRPGTSVETQYGAAMVHDSEILAAIEEGGTYLMRSGHSADLDEFVVDIITYPSSKL